MGIVVQKFGGTSVADADRIRNVAARVVRDRRVRATRSWSSCRRWATRPTSCASSLARSATEPPPRELDMLLSSGERISMALVAMAIDALGHSAESYTGSQAGIITDALHGRARIADIRPRRILEALERGTIPIIAGFQGVVRGDARHHDARAAARRTSRRSRWPLRWGPSCARSTPTSTACTPPIRASFRTRGSCTP